MSTGNYYPGQTITIKGAPQTIGSIHGNRVHYYFKRGGPPRTTTIEELDRLREEGALTLEPSELSGATAPTDAVLADFPPEEQEVIKRRLVYVRAVSGLWTGTPRLRLTVAATKQLIAQIADKRRENGPSYPTLKRWIASYHAAEGDPRSLLPAVSRRGNRTERLPYDVMTLIDRAADEWLQPHRPAIQWVYGPLGGRIVEINTLRDAGNKLRIPHYRTLVRHFKRLDPFLVATKRLGKAAGERVLRSRAGGPMASLPLERVEIDHTSLDIIVVGEDWTILGRPTITVAIDKLTRAIVGFYISFTPPSFLSVMQCLRHVLKDKSYVRTRFPKIRKDWDAHGVPMLIISDNGKEFLSPSFDSACEQLTVSTQLCPPGSPWFKGSIERHMQTQNQGLIHNLPGTTKSNPKARGDYKPTDQAAITLDNLDYLMHKWIVDVYMQTPHSAIGTSPAIAWKRAVELSPPRTLDPSVNLDVILGIVRDRSISNGRVPFQNIPYHSPALVALATQLKRGTRVQVKINPEDLGYVNVLDPITRQYVEAKAV
ncbi:MAG: Mu transposase C-terminal domain-containing protein, partial [Thiobacillaceae bacterium]